MKQLHLTVRLSGTPRLVTGLACARPAPKTPRFPPRLWLVGVRSSRALGFLDNEKSRAAKFTRDRLGTADDNYCSQQKARRSKSLKLRAATSCFLRSQDMNTVPVNSINWSSTMRLMLVQARAVMIYYQSKKHAVARI